MRKILKFIILSICLLLAGCGKTQEDTPVVKQDSSYDIPNETETDSNSIDETATGDIVDSETEDEEYEDDEEDDDDEYTDEAKGIIAMIYNSGSSDARETIVSINPDDGRAEVIARFPNCTKDLSNTYGPGYLVKGYGNYRNAFSDDYSKEAATQFFSEDHSTHAGWIDTDGDFFDVSEEVGEVSESDFAEVPQHHACGFTWNGKFAYTVDVDGDTTYHIIDPDDVSEGAYKEKSEWDKRATLDNYLLHPTDWISDKKCLADYDLRDVETEDKTSVIYDKSAKKIIEYIPNKNKSRRNWSGVASPDGKHIAFLSKLSGKEDVELYITSPKGGEPNQLELEMPDELQLQLKNDLKTHTKIYCTLLDWK